MEQLIAARLFESIVARAGRLFEDGYSAEVKATVDEQPVSYTVTSPDGERYEVSLLFEQCTCPCFKKWLTCKHVRGLDRLLEEQALDLQARMLDSAELETTGCDPHYWIDLQFA